MQCQSVDGVLTSDMISARAFVMMERTNDSFEQQRLAQLHSTKAYGTSPALWELR